MDGVRLRYFDFFVATDVFYARCCLRSQYYYLFFAVMKVPRDWADNKASNPNESSHGTTNRNNQID